MGGEEDRLIRDRDSITEAAEDELMGGVRQEDEEDMRVFWLLNIVAGSNNNHGYIVFYRKETEWKCFTIFFISSIDQCNSLEWFNSDKDFSNR